ncbi:sensor histidine kinase [Pseudoalteromonas fuliginea]|uniref:histidine kinase n=1 Tax=Pseudoalteromonas fuliginea TaxID=1872678 RepID=A0ABD3YD37_9GAMM|nr:ATP-binding protein [Pseudoalteromonas fuliginea]KDC52790.1 histidine kinase [Pseudoalteromonas fuliginea]KJZ28998.1 histidine kinase [Pseudoalteromonas fuliginea]
MPNIISNFTLSQKIVLICGLCSALPVVIIAALSGFDMYYTLLLILLTLTFSTLLSRAITKPIKLGMQSLETGLLNFKDGELSSLLAYKSNDELGKLCQLYNQTAKQLRQEKQWIYQRELMLDKVLQSSPQALLLVNDNNTVVFSNLISRSLFNSASRLEGMQLSKLLENSPLQLVAAIEHGIDGLFNIEIENQDSQTWHLATGEFLLNNQKHHLYIFKQLTRELSRQEVAVWKKVIRIISHELNNSLGPMSSMLHSAQLLANKVDEPRLARVFATIDERISHLAEFVQGYGKFAKLPQPQKTRVNWQNTLNNLKNHWQFSYEIKNSHNELQADQTQLEQLLINLLKNSHESGSNSNEIHIQVEFVPQACVINVSDCGKGMSEQVMANALVPFYSTKSTGSGLGLALCREIAEAHQGHISLHNKIEGGLNVQVSLPYS